jgi:DNA-binding response OmpR family regulator
VGLDGVVVCRELQAIAQATSRKIPVWLITGAYSAEVAALGKEAGAVAVLRKPFDLSSLSHDLEAQWSAAAASSESAVQTPVPVEDKPVK